MLVLFCFILLNSVLSVVMLLLLLGTLLIMKVMLQLAI